MAIIQRSPEPFFYPGGKVGILLIHGFTGTPSELRPMGQYFQEQGYTVHAPLLAGHGTSPEEMAQTTWADWWQSVLEGYDRIRSEVDTLYVAGLSMGGVLTLLLATEREVDGIIPMCAPIWIRDKRTLLVDLVRFVMPYKARSIHRDPEIEQHLVPYDKTPLKCVGELTRLIRTVKTKLSEVKVPTLIIQAVNDELILPESADYIYEHISSEQKSVSWYEKSCHIITVDKERKKLFEEVVEFIQKNLNR